MEFDEAKCLDVLKDDSGDPVFVEYAEFLKNQGRSLEAMEICLRGLSNNPSCRKGRLLLARLFYEQKFFPFAGRELEQLAKELPENQSLKRLLKKFSVESKDTSVADTDEKVEDDTVVAEADFDFECLDMLDEEE